MRWLCHIRLRRLLERPKRKDALLPLLQAVKPETPPQGLLKNIEQAMASSLPEASKQRWGWRPKTLLACAALGAAGVGLLLNLPAQRIQLVDPSGHPFAYLEQQENITLAQMTIAPLPHDVPMRWRLWGIKANGKDPAYLGAFGPAGIVVERPNQFSGFAMSLEHESFSGTRPVGPIIFLARRK